MMSGCETNKSHCSNTPSSVPYFVYQTFFGRAISVLSVYDRLLVTLYRRESLLEFVCPVT